MSNSQDSQVYQFNKIVIVVKTLHWGQGIPVNNLMTVFESCMTEFLSTLDLNILQQYPLCIANSVYKQIPYPMYVKHDGTGAIFIENKDNAWWNRYAYQYLHEFCHYVIDKDFNPHEKFLWLEEVFCELASVFFLKKMAATWEAAAPTPWLTGYYPHLASYADGVITKARQNLTIDFEEWYRGNIDKLYLEPVNRDNNAIVAAELLEIFEQNPSAWQCAQYLNKFTYDSNATSINEYLNIWEAALPTGLVPVFQPIKSKLRIDKL